MAWSSFADIVAQIVTAIESNADLAAFCRSRFSREVTVRKDFRLRTEIGLHELPIVMLTAPGQRTEPGTARTLDRTYTVRLYCGFKQDDRASAQTDIVKFEEYIEQAILKDSTLQNLAAVIYPGDSANDEGFNHPVYYIAKEFKVLIERDF